MKTAQPPSVTIRQIEFELEKAEHGMGMPYDAERVAQLRGMLHEARNQKLSQALAAAEPNYLLPARSHLTYHRAPARRSLRDRSRA